jgi:hypothetical protein
LRFRQLASVCIERPGQFTRFVVVLHGDHIDAIGHPQTVSEACPVMTIENATMLVFDDRTRTPKRWILSRKASSPWPT